MNEYNMTGFVVISITLIIAAVLYDRIADKLLRWVCIIAFISWLIFMWYGR